MTIDTIEQMWDKQNKLDELYLEIATVDPDKVGEIRLLQARINYRNAEITDFQIEHGL